MPSPPATSGPVLYRALLLALTLCAVASLTTLANAAKPSKRAGGTTHALLINGGSKPNANYLSHLNHLQDLVQLLA